MSLEKCYVMIARERQYAAYGKSVYLEYEEKSFN